MYWRRALGHAAHERLSRPVLPDRIDTVDTEEDSMAKDRKRGNREAKKPKKIKPALIAASALPIKGQLAAIGLPKVKV
jgi:hypothetical protein